MIKRIFAVGAVALALAACCKKNDKKDSSAAGAKGVSGAVAASEENTQELPKLAITDSAGVYKLSYHLEEGKTYPFTTVQKDVTTIKDPTGKSVSGTQEIKDEMSFKVNDFKDGVYSITVNLIGKSVKSTSNGQQVVIDTKGNEPKEEQFKAMWILNKALSGNQLEMKLGENGEIRSITGFDAVYSKVDKAMAAVIKDAKQRAQFLTNFKQGFGEAILKEQYSKSLNILPKKGVKIGEQWSESENISQDGKIKLTTTYQLDKIEGGEAVISVSGGIPKKSNSEKNGEMTHSMSVESTQKGSLHIDARTGWMKTSTQTMNTTQTESISNGKETQTMTKVNNSTVTINP